MSTDQWTETLVDREVTYTVEVNGELIVVENVPARVCVETGDQFFSPETVEHLQRIIWERGKPSRMIEVPVYAFG